MNGSDHCRTHEDSHFADCRQEYCNLMFWLKDENKISSLNEKSDLDTTSLIYILVKAWFLNLFDSTADEVQITSIRPIKNNSIHKEYVVKRERPDSKEFLLLYSRDELNQQVDYSTASYDSIFHKNNSKEAPFGDGVYTSMYSKPKPLAGNCYKNERTENTYLLCIGSLPPSCSVTEKSLDEVQHSSFIQESVPLNPLFSITFHSKSSEIVKVGLEESCHTLVDALQFISEQYPNTEQQIIVEVCSDLHQEPQNMIQITRSNLVFNFRNHTLKLVAFGLCGQNITVNQLHLEGELVISNARDVKILNSCFSRSKQTGISIFGSSQIELKNVDCQQNEMHGIGLLHCNHCIIEQATCCNNLDCGITCSNSSDIKIKGCQCNGNNHCGIYCDDKSEHINIEHCECNNNIELDGICIENECQVNISHCECNYNKRMGIVCDVHCNMTIEDCQCNRNMHSGIVFQNRSKGCVRNSFCNSNEQNGIICYTKCYARIEHCECNSSAKMNGIHFQDNSSGFISNSKCNFNNTDGIYCDKSKNNVMIDVCECNDNSESGVFLNEQSIGSISHTTCCRNKQMGIYCATPEEVTIIDCSNSE